MATHERCAIYLRTKVKTVEDPALVLQFQREQCTAYAEEQGWSTGDDLLYQDISAADIWDRPGMRTLVRDMRASKFDVVLASDVTRFSRHFIQLQWLSKECDQCRVEWDSIAESLAESTDPAAQHIIQTMKRLVWEELQRRQ